MNYVISDLKSKEIFETFYKNQLQETNQKEFESKKESRGKVINYNSFNSWINKKDIL